MYTNCYHGREKLEEFFLQYIPGKMIYARSSEKLG